MEDLVLQSNMILYLDHHTDIFIWSGKDMMGNEYDALRQRCVQLANTFAIGRFPNPQLMSFYEGSSMARWLSCRLIPSHKDAREQQLKSFPLLVIIYCVIVIIY